MKKIILVYGSITGAVIILSMTLGIYVAKYGGNAFFSSEALGYSIMLIGFSMIFVATKKYRDEDLGGIIKFGTALKIGLGISLMAGLVYVIVWEINLYLTDYEFISEYTDSIINSARESGASAQELEATIEQMEEMERKYDNPWYRLPLTFTEIFPVGLLLSLISAALFRNQNFLSSQKEETTA
ncbi:hypothetical protein A8B79_10850 [Balneola sp. EhC07]|jgi:hypothetical protein|uniref:DUF4199 domain-containing protein n=1 Tax=Balneola sp. EhC07 TaxID=1849360 RepID=UPI0007F3F4DF|nr:DUF4199 domain-containing protein [Balneola sp. EhC07]OAN60434.1 hypothetical protein A8B79_10850 [Balneola sp. EhC07]